MVTVIYTDGSCRPTNPGPGGYGAIVVFDGRQVSACGAYTLTTNNRMELMAVIRGLELLAEPTAVEVVSDSQYVVKGVSCGWAANWRAGGWRRRGKPVPNADLWTRLLTLCEKHTVTMTWIKGHAGHPLNEKCDQLAGSAVAGNREEDGGYIAA